MEPSAAGEGGFPQGGAFAEAPAGDGGLGGELSVAGEGGMGAVPGPPELVATPTPGTFVDVVKIELSLSTDAPELTLRCTVDGSLPVATSSPECDELELTRSTGVRAIAVDERGLIRAAGYFPYIKLEADVAAFSSRMPIALLWSPTDPVPPSKTDDYASFSLTTFDAAATATDGMNRWPAPATAWTRAGIRIRGSSSASFPKRPWKLETWGPLGDEDDKISVLGMPRQSDWVLIAPLEFDRALMRNSLAFALSNDIGRYAPRTRHAELFVVGGGASVKMAHYVGIYEVVEQIKPDPERVAIKRVKPTDVTGAAVTGGYLWKVDRLSGEESGFVAGTAGGAFDFQQPFVFDDPNDLEVAPQQRAYLSSFLDEVAEALVDDDFVNPTTGLHYGDLIDVGSFIDHQILNVLAKNPDAFRLSAFMHKDRGGKVFAGPLWDFDRTMGCSSDVRASSPLGWDASGASDASDVFDVGFYRGLFSDPAFTAKYWARWQELLEGPLSAAAVADRVDQIAAELDAAAVERNFKRWSLYAPRGSFQNELTLLKQWLDERQQWIAQCLTLPDPRDCVAAPAP
jgi:CotH kinase protein/Chitobiase/beta-hexosaminidase C-terminal domain